MRRSTVRLLVIFEDSERNRVAKRGPAVGQKMNRSRFTSGMPTSASFGCVS
ncbi:hypothetical protein BH18VER1_BH18VER1_06870 [soil metagenome]